MSQSNVAPQDHMVIIDLFNWEESHSQLAGVTIIGHLLQLKKLVLMLFCRSW